MSRDFLLGQDLRLWSTILIISLVDIQRWCLTLYMNFHAFLRAFFTDPNIKVLRVLRLQLRVETPDRVRLSDNHAVLDLRVDHFILRVFPFWHFIFFFEVFINVTIYVVLCLVCMLNLRFLLQQAFPANAVNRVADSTAKGRRIR